MKLIFSSEGKIEKEINSVKHKIDPLEQSVESRLKETLHKEFKKISQVKKSRLKTLLR